MSTDEIENRKARAASHLENAGRGGPDYGKTGTNWIDDLEAKVRAARASDDLAILLRALVDITEALKAKGFYGTMDAYRDELRTVAARATVGQCLEAGVKTAKWLSRAQIRSGDFYQTNIVTAAKAMVADGRGHYTYHTQYSSGNSLWRYTDKAVLVDIETGEIR